MTLDDNKDGRPKKRAVRSSKRGGKVPKAEPTSHHQTPPAEGLRIPVTVLEEQDPSNDSEASNMLSQSPYSADDNSADATVICQTAQAMPQQQFSQFGFVENFAMKENAFSPPASLSADFIPDQMMTSDQEQILVGQMNSPTCDDVNVTESFLASLNDNSSLDPVLHNSQTFMGLGTSNQQQQVPCYNPANQSPQTISSQPFQPSYPVQNSIPGVQTQLQTMPCTVATTPSAQNPTLASLLQRNLQQTNPRGAVRVSVAMENYPTDNPQVYSKSEVLCISIDIHIVVGLYTEITFSVHVPLDENFTQDHNF